VDRVLVDESVAPDDPGDAGVDPRVVLGGVDREFIILVEVGVGLSPRWRAMSSVIELVGP
jgi:hypothetical protein